MVAEIDMVAAIVTAEETATEAETATEVAAAAAMAAQGATAAAVVVMGADRLVRTGVAAVVEAVVTGRAPGPTPHAEAGAIPTTTESAPSRAGPTNILFRTISE